MKLKTRSLRANLLIYFLVFSAIILSFLYFFQIIFFNTYYKINRTNILEQTVSQIEKNYNKKNREDILNTLSIDNEVCIQIIDDDNLVYYSDYYRHCAGKDDAGLKEIKEEFMKSKNKYLKLEFINNAYNNKSLVYGKQIQKNTYLFGMSMPLSLYACHSSESAGRRSSDRSSGITAIRATTIKRENGKHCGHQTLYGRNHLPGNEFTNG